jgi:hypothetical protein
MKTHRTRWLIAAGVVVVILLLIGYVRLPYAAVRGLADYDMLASEPILHANASHLRVSPVQAWWLRTRLRNLSEGDTAPRISVRVEWNALLVARVNAGHYVSPTGAEGRDSLYFWLLGLWIRVYDFCHVMA